MRILPIVLLASYFQQAVCTGPVSAMDTHATKRARTHSSDSSQLPTPPDTPKKKSKTLDKENLPKEMYMADTMRDSHLSCGNYHDDYSIVVRNGSIA